VLARTLYPDAALRSYGDIDLMVQDRHEHAAAAALLGCGFTEISYGPEKSRRERAPHVHEGAALHRKFVMWRGEAAHAVIDLHIDPLQLGLKSTGEAARWERAVPAPRLAGALMLWPDDQIVPVTVHVHRP